MLGQWLGNNCPLFPIFASMKKLASLVSFKRKTMPPWLAVGFFFILPLATHAQVNFESSNLPIVILNTNGQGIPDEPKIDAQMQVIDQGPGQINHLSDPPNHFNGNIGIELRGSTSNFFSDKKPYAVEIRDDTGNDLDFPLLGMPAGADWAFLAPFNDKSLVRDAFMLGLARNVMPWASRSRFVELVLNGQYEGVYLVTEKIKRDKDRVDIAKLKADDLAGDSLTGGYILKIDKTTGAQNEGWTSPYVHAPGAWQTTLWQVEYPKPIDLQPVQKDYIQQWVTGFEAAMRMPDFADTSIGYPKYLDVESFVDFTLLNELAKCVDAYRISTFMYKDKDSNDPRLHAGPVWDFNIALGNAGYCTAESPQGWIIDFNEFCPDDQWIVQFWWKKMWEDPMYRRRLQDRWTELRAGPLSNDQVFHLLDSLTSTVQEAQVRNFQRWPVLNTWVWPNVFCCGTYNEHTSFLRNWITQRLQWMDNTAQTLYVGEYEAQNRFKTKVFPNPVADGVLKFKCFSHYDDEVLVRVFDAAGRFVEAVAFDPEFNEENTFEWRYDVLRPGVYFYEILLNQQRESSGKIVVAP